MTSNLGELSDTVLKLKSKKYKKLPEDLIIRILQIENDYLEDRSLAVKEVKKAIESHFASLEESK